MHLLLSNRRCAISRQPVLRAGRILSPQMKPNETHPGAAPSTPSSSSSSSSSSAPPPVADGADARRGVCSLVGDFIVRGVSFDYFYGKGELVVAGEEGRRSHDKTAGLFVQQAALVTVVFTRETARFRGDYAIGPRGTGATRLVLLDRH